MSVELDKGGRATPSAEVLHAPVTEEQSEPPAKTVPPALATVEPGRARAIVLKAVLRGLCLDDPWRHAFLRNRWIGV